MQTKWTTIAAQSVFKKFLARTSQMRHPQTRRRGRRGVSPVIAEVLLIAVSLIAGVALGGFAFGLLGAYAHPAEVAAQVRSCSSIGASSEVCTIDLTNVGSSDVGTTSACYIDVGGAKVSGTVGSGGSVPGGGSLTGVSCMVQGASAVAGTTITGSISLTSGYPVYFAGTAS